MKSKWKQALPQFTGIHGLVIVQYGVPSSCYVVHTPGNEIIQSYRFHDLKKYRSESQTRHLMLPLQRISMILPCRSYIIWADIIAVTLLAKHIWYVSTNDVLSYQAPVSYLSSRIPRSYYATAHFDSISARHPARLVLTSLGIWKVDECDTAIQQAQDCFWWW